MTYPFCCHVIFICLFIASGSSTRLYATNNKHQQDENLDILMFDTNNTKLQVYAADGFQDTHNTTVNGAAVICQDIYHSYWNADSYTYPRALFSWRIAEQGPSYYTIDYDHQFVIMGCTLSQDQVLLVDTINKTDGIVFELSLATLYGTVVTRQLIATLPDTRLYAYSFGANIFSFNSDFSELWIALTDIKKGQGILAVIDTKTGNWTKSYSYPKRAGSPYFTLPQTLSEGSFKGAVKSKPSSETLQFVTLQINEKTNELSLSVDIEDAAYLYGDGLPMTVCDDTGYVIAGNSDSLNAFNINTGKQTAQYNLKGGAETIDMGGLACINIDTPYFQ